MPFRFVALTLNLLVFCTIADHVPVLRLSLTTENTFTVGYWPSISGLFFHIFLLIAGVLAFNFFPSPLKVHLPLYQWSFRTLLSYFLAIAGVFALHFLRLKIFTSVAVCRTLVMCGWLKRISSWAISGNSCQIIKRYPCSLSVDNQLLFILICSSVPDPDPHVFGPPGSGSTSQRYGSGSFSHHAKIVRKTLITSIL
jgi:hypothetical protein